MLPNDDFQSLVNGLQESRQELSSQQQRLFLAREKQKQIRAEQEQLARIFDPQNPQHQRRQRQLNAMAAAAESDVARWTEITSGSRGIVNERLDLFLNLSDPREHLGRLNDVFPILMMPLRIETRFKTFLEDGADRYQLWVRVYPDDCMVDSFEEILSDIEVRSAQRYWLQMWRAGKVEDDERAAWRGLVSSHGSGRAMWIIENYIPKTNTPIPQKPDNKTLHLVTGTDAPLPPAEQSAADTFWAAVWAAGNDANAVFLAQQALEAAVGAQRAQVILDEYRPFNLADMPPENVTRAEMTVVPVTVVFPTAGEVDTKRQSWSQAARSDVLPDRLVFLGYIGQEKIEAIGNLIPSPLMIGPNPAAPENEQIRQEGDKITVGDDIKWMVDFDEAVAKGMGFRIDLNHVQFRTGFDKIFVLGVRMSSTTNDARSRLETLITHHHKSRKGFSILPQGSATNNTEEKGADYTTRDDADTSFELIRDPDKLPIQETTDWFSKQDGQRLAEWLGINLNVLQTVPYASHTDVREALAMNNALWPATLGYFLSTMMAPIFNTSGRIIELTQEFYTHFVSGRGMIPAVRIGKQPYGILPTSVFSRLDFPRAGGVNLRGGLAIHQAPIILARLHDILMKTYEDWGKEFGKVSYVGKSGDPHQILLDILGLHATSVEYYNRGAETLDQLFNRLNFSGLGGKFLQAIIALGLYETGMEVIRNFGYTGEAPPDILEKFFFKKADLLKGDLIDDQPLSESNPIRAYTPDPNGQNYIEWLIQAARTSLEAVRKQEGFKDNKPPSALLYLMLRHAIQNGYYGGGVRLYERAGLFNAENIHLAYHEPSFFHISQQTQTSESRYQLLYQAQPQVTNQDNLLVAEYIPLMLGELEDLRSLNSQINSLEVLSSLPTARLERLFAEHIDTCSYRIDSWLIGLVNYKLALARYMGQQMDDDEQAASLRGLYLGAYGWLEDVRPEFKKFEPVALSEALDAVFNPKDESGHPLEKLPPLMRDVTNDGYVHAPSLNHAVTAAVLLNGYKSNVDPKDPDIFAVNLSSERVRRALGILEGIRGEQSLSALLGYQFERGLHDRYHLAEVDEFIYDLRIKFPIRANRIKTTRIEDDIESIEKIEARNVMDGLDFVKHIEKPGNETYPFGLTEMPDADENQKKALNAEAQRLRDLYDAVADLAIAEGVHQVVQGNFDRASATLEAYSSGGFPPIPDVVQTPRSGIGLTHRVALHLEMGVSATNSPLASVPGMTPRASAEPAINKWLAELLPDPATVGCRVSFEDGLGNADEITVTQAQLGLQPLDLLYMLNLQDEQALTAFDDRIIQHMLATITARPDVTLTIHYTKRPNDTPVSFFELASLIASLRTLILSARPLNAGDLALANEANSSAAQIQNYEPTRLTLIRDALTAAGGPIDVLQALAAELAIDLDLNNTPPAPNLGALISSVDNRQNRFVNALSALNLYGLPQTGYGFAMLWKRNRYEALLEDLRALTQRWQERLDACDDLLDDEQNLPPTASNTEHVELLQEAEARVAAVLTAPQPELLNDYRTVVVSRRNAFSTKLDAFNLILQTTTNSLGTLMNTVANELVNIEQFDLTVLDIAAHQQEVLLFSQDLQQHSSNLAAEINKRITAMNDDLTHYDAAADPTERKKLFKHAAALLLGEDFLMVPAFDLTLPQADELGKAYAAQNTLLDYQKNTLGTLFPVDDWLHSLARVREKMHAWENVMLMGGLIGQKEPELHPLQLPYKDDDTWLALEFPETYVIESDRLLYTAHHAAAFDKTKPQCGLLLDEWTEIIPTTEETTGLVFHYDRPNAEPPQAMLLVTSPSYNGEWSWKDLVDSLHETLELAKRRAIEPDHLSSTPYARYLPATISAVTMHPITIALNYAVNNQVFQLINVEGDGNG